MDRCAHGAGVRLAVWLASGLAIAGCGDDDDGDKQAPEPVPAAVIDAAVTFDRSTFCREILPGAEVAEIAGKKMMRLPDAHTGAGVALVQCHFTAADPDAGATDAEEIHVLVDCRAPTTGVEQRSLVEKMGSEKDDQVRSIDIGGGGALVFHQRFRARFAAVAHAELPCAIAVESRRAVGDGDELALELVALVHERLSASNRPRPAPPGKSAAPEQGRPGK